MWRWFFSVLMMAGAAQAAPAKNILDGQILPGFATLARQAQVLDQTAQVNCTADDPGLRNAFDDTLAAWTGVSHLRFGPSEAGNRGFALAFWPDARGKTAKALRGLIASEDAAVADLARFAEVSIAGRGLYAMEYLLYDPAISMQGSADYRCALTRAIAADIAEVAQALTEDWQTRYAQLMRAPQAGGPYQSEAEVLQEYFKALGTGLQITGDLRLGRPLGTFDKPRPKRAEAWRSGNALRQVEVSLITLRELAETLAEGDETLQARLDEQFAHALHLAERIDDPSLAGVTEPAKRFRIEAVQQAVTDIRTTVSEQLGPKLGVSAGFNSLDGD